MIRLAFMTDAAYVIGASTPEANAKRFEALPPGLRAEMMALYQADAVVVGRASLGPWLERTDTKVYLLTRSDAPAPAPHIEVVRDPAALVEQYRDRDLLVAGGRGVFRAFLPYAERIDVALTDDLVPGDLVFDDWRQRFRTIETKTWDGGQTQRMARRGVGLNHGISLYLDGIRDGRVEAVHAHTGAQYRQHSTGVPDGKAGFIEFFEDFLERCPERDIQILRALEDGDKVALHAFQSINGGEARWVTTDWFQLDEEQRIIEHWDIIAAYAERTPSGHTSIDGPTEVTDLEHTEANKAVVRELLGLLARSADLGRFDDLVAEDYIQHNPEVEDGRAAFRAKLEAADRKLYYDEVVLLVGEGNFVSALSKTTFDGVPYAQGDIFRLEGGRIVEHWDAAEPVPTPEVAKNSGKF